MKPVEVRIGAELRGLIPRNRDVLASAIEYDDKIVIEVETPMKPFSWARGLIIGAETEGGEPCSQEKGS